MYVPKASMFFAGTHPVFAPFAVAECAIFAGRINVYAEASREKDKISVPIDIFMYPGNTPIFVIFILVSVFLIFVLFILTLFPV